MITAALFYLFAGLCIVSGVIVISARNPVHSVLFLILAFFNAAGLFVLLGAEFIAMLTVIVYVGAVAVLFLFVVMMLNVNFAELRASFVKYLPIGGLVAATLLFELIIALMYSVSIQGKGITSAEFVANDAVSNTENLGLLLYTHYGLAFQLAGLILLVAMVGAIVLTHRSRPGVRRQDIAKQIGRKREDSIEILKIQSRKGV